MEEHLVMLKLFAIAACVALVSACGLNEEMVLEGDAVFNAETYIEARAEKDAAFGDAETSPLPKEEVDSFTGLQYFDPSEDYVVKATLKRYNDPDTIQLATTKDDLRDAVLYGTFTFSVNGEDCSLAGYRFLNAKHPYFFVPFKDATTGSETYVTGRYMDIEMHDGDDYVLDFNGAYSPYCAYNDKYSCPLVPSVNTLTVAIKSGEKNLH